MIYYVAAQCRPSAVTIEKLNKAQGPTINIGPIAEAQHIASVMKDI